MNVRQGTMLRGVGLLLLVTAVTIGCSHREPNISPMGISDLEILPPPPPKPAPEGYKLRLRPPETPPDVLLQDLPDYPETALASEVTCTARLLYHIETNGTATLVRLQWDLPPPAEHRPLFEDAIRQAVAGWEFVPARKWVPTKLEDGSTRGVPHAVPKAERAILTFRVDHGEGVVE